MPVKYMTKPGAHGTLHYYAVEVRPLDPGQVGYSLRRWAYSPDHALEKVDDEMEEWGDRTTGKVERVRDMDGPRGNPRKSARKIPKHKNHHVAVGGTFYTPGGRRGVTRGPAKAGFYPVRWADGTLGRVRDTEHDAYPTATSRPNPAYVAIPIAGHANPRRNPDNRADFAEAARRIELAASLRKVPAYDIRTARLIRLALAHVPARDHLWTRAAPSRDVPGSATNSDMHTALQRCGRGAEADEATGRVEANRIHVPAGAGKDYRRNPKITIQRYDEQRHYVRVNGDKIGWIIHVPKTTSGAWRWKAYAVMFDDGARGHAINYGNPFHTKAAAVRELVAEHLRYMADSPARAARFPGRD